MRLFERTFEITNRTRVLDVGGSPDIWETASVAPQVTILNLPSALGPQRPGLLAVAGDGRMLPFADKSFDIVFSNSVIEHVGTLADQRRFSDEIARVGRQYWVQTPNRHFPVELHVMLPFIHFFPKPVQRSVVRRFTLWQYATHPTPDVRRDYIHHFLNELNLLDTPALQALFPGARIISERVLGMPKSLIAVQTQS
ncbi:MAG: methyltransferase domain-containing protein [Acidobacteriaceae bacterium]|nr:methyltransferase domain-containing protein [Acidobacteriaceae bacterium]